MRLPAAGLTVALAFGAAHAVAQTEPDRAIQTIGSARVRTELWNWFQTPDADGRYAYIGSLFRLGARQDLGAFSWTAEAAVPVLLGLPDDALAPAPQGALGLGANYRASIGSANGISVFVKQAHVAAKLQPQLVLRAGRFEYSDGLEAPIPDGPLGALRRERVAERLLGPFGFSHVGRSLDGADLRYTTTRTGLTLMAARATQGVFRLQGMRELAVGVAYLAFTHNFTIDKARADARAFVLGYRDDRDLPKIDNRPANLRLRDSTAVQIATVGGHLLALTPIGNGNADFLVWSAAQFGEWGAQDHNGFGLALEAGYQWPWPGVSPWVRAGYWRGSGDDNPLDARHGTFFQPLPTPRVHARFPFYNLMNTEDLFVEVIVRPTAALTVRADAHALSLKEPTDFWYAGGGAYEPRTFGYAARPGGAGGLASVIGLSGDYTISPHLAAGAYVGRADPGIVIEAIYPTTGTAWLGFLELRWRR